MRNYTVLSTVYSSSDFFDRLKKTPFRVDQSLVQTERLVRRVLARCCWVLEKK